jgi:hypothetical protein
MGARIRRLKMGVAEHTMSRLAEAAERDRIAVLSQWAGAPGWSAERIADCAGLPAREVSEAVRAAASTASRPTERRRDMVDGT